MINIKRLSGGNVRPFLCMPVPHLPFYLIYCFLLRIVTAAILMQYFCLAFHQKYYKNNHVDQWVMMEKDS